MSPNFSLTRLFSIVFKTKNINHNEETANTTAFYRRFWAESYRISNPIGRCTLERYRYDYGYDAFIKTYNEIGEYENGHIEIQLKSTDNLKYSTAKKAILFDIEKS